VRCAGTTDESHWGIDGPGPITPEPDTVPTVALHGSYNAPACRKKRAGAHIEVEVRLNTEIYVRFSREMGQLQTLEGLGIGDRGLFQHAGPFSPPRDSIFRLKARYIGSR
jgi:hypothetical protein